jgi:hypothetical protein
MPGARKARSKNLGDAFGVPVVDFILLLNASFSSLPFSWLPLVSILPSIFHGKICNDVLLQLFDCIELMKNEVKKKMNVM